MREWSVKYKLQRQGKYFFRTVRTGYQHDAVKLVQSEIPSAIICGNARAI